MTAITPAAVPAPFSSTIGPRFARGLWRIAAADASSGNEVELMRDGMRIFDAMIEMIEQAKDTIELESYIVNSDSVGTRFADALIAAAARGVQVRLIADWVGSWTTTRAYWRSLRDGGVDVRIFNRPGFRRWLGLVPRDHRKLLVADQLVALTGGIGLSEEWSGIVKRKKRAPWRDHENWRDSALTSAMPGFGALHETTFRHVQQITPEGVVQRVASVSHVAVMSPPERDAVLDEVRAVLATHPAVAGRETVEIPYRVDCFWAEHV